MEDRRQGPPFAAFAQSFQGRRKKRKNGGNNSAAAAVQLAFAALACMQLKRARGGLKELKKLARGPGAYRKTRLVRFGLFLGYKIFLLEFLDTKLTLDMYF